VLPTLTQTLPEATPKPFDNSLIDLPIINPDNATHLELLAELPGTLVFSPDMTTFALVREDGIHIHDTEGLREIAFLPCERGIYCGFDYSPDGRDLAWSPQDGILQIWEGSNGSILRELSGIADTCCAKITYSPDGSYLAVMDGQHNYSLWDLEDDREHFTLGEFQRVYFSPDGKTIAAESPKSLTITLWAIGSKQETQILSGFMTAAPSYHVDFSPDWRYLLWGARSRSQLQSVSTGQMGIEFRISNARFSPDSQIIAGTEDGWGPFECTGQLCLFDLPSGELLTKLEHETLIRSLDFSPDGHLLASLTQDLIRIWDLATRSELVVLEHQSKEGAWRLTFSPDRRVLAVHIPDSFTQLWGVVPQ
jgi:WD40 repeat protein